ncbi:MAG: Flp family type IVb pilin [Stellaceae bacterium]
MHALFNDLFEDESGVTAIEYGLIAAFIAVVCVAAWAAIGNNLDSAFTNLESSM